MLQAKWIETMSHILSKIKLKEHKYINKQTQTINNIYNSQKYHKIKKQIYNIKYDLINKFKEFFVEEKLILKGKIIELSYAVNVKIDD